VSFPSHRLITGLVAATFGSLCVLLTAKFLWTGTVLDKPGEQTFAEAGSAYIARRVQNGGDLYGDWRVRPHVVTLYGPALYLPVAYLGRWIHADVHGLYVIGRWISVLTTVGTAGLIVWLMRRKPGADPLFCAMTAMVFLTCEEVLASFDLSFRADAPACFLTLLGLALVMHSDRSGFLYGSLAVFALAFLYKQSSLVGPPAVVLWVWSLGRRRHAITYAALGILVILGLVGLCEAVTNGRYALNNFVALRGNTGLVNVPGLFSEIAWGAILPLAIGSWAAVGGWGVPQTRLLAVAFVTSVVLNAAATYRDGSGVTYYMVPLAIGCVLCGRQLSTWWRERATTPAAAAALGIAMTLAAVRYVPQVGVRLVELPARWRGFQFRHEQHRDKAEFIRSLADYVNRLPGPVLCQFNDIALYCPNSILLDTFMFSTTSDAGVFDDRELVREIRQRQVAAIILDPVNPQVYQSTDFFNRRWRQAMEGRYELVGKYKWAEIYRPVEHGTDTGRRPAPG